jgi:hypothetical protein
MVDSMEVMLLSFLGIFTFFYFGRRGCVVVSTHAEAHSHRPISTLSLEFE